ncbi:putative ferric-chelate reductase 1 homolog [Aplysia californica]|uniref:Ferric-chelate reductase 1 homolog n=1 Tax=Aplysia californica TaxID=6500 RepID=A0ABM0K4I0_APLCA|nr:putative ferric-chelate reductase 1 homolog [Aplysia californica]
MDYRTPLVLLVVGACLCGLTDGFGRGAPASTCFTRYPKHGEAAQTVDSPFVVQLSPDVYTPGQTVNVVISQASANPTRQFVGFMIGAFRASDQPGVTEEVIGEFTTVPDDKVQVFSCFPGYKNFATHKNTDQVPRVTLTWTAPDVNVGNLTLRATIVENFKTFWTGLEFPLPVSGAVSEPVETPEYQVVPVRSIVSDVKFQGCGTTKGCLFYPDNCNGPDCDAAISFEYRESSDDFVVEMVSNKAEDYISVAFSQDDKMGDDETVSCVSQGGEMSVQHGWNPKRYNELLLNRYITETEISQSDGRLQCRFVLPRVTYVYQIDQAAVPLTYTNRTYDRNLNWHLHLAWGRAYPGSNVLSRHNDAPVVTEKRVNLKVAEIYQGLTVPVLVQAHAAVMLVAWIFLTGLVTVLSRHYKDWLSEKRVGGTKVWFQLHRGVAILVFLLTVIGIILVFAHFGPGIQEAADPHAYVGLTVTALVSLQVIGGALRPGFDNSLRPVFNWAHWFLGQASHILAGITMFLAFDISYLRSEVREFGFAVLGVWVAVQLAWHVGFEILKCRQKDSSSDSYEFKVTEGVSEGQQGSKSSLHSILLVIYAVMLAAICVAAIVAFLSQ